VAQCRLPFSFNVLSKLPRAPRPHETPETRKRRRPEQEDGDLPAPERTVRRRMDGNGQVHHPAQDIGHPSAPQGHEDNSSSMPPLVPPPQPAQNVALSSAELNTVKPPYRAASLPETTGERTPTLTEVNPDSASITGGVRIWLKGTHFPALFPLFARFGTAVVPTVRVCFYFSRWISPCLLDVLCLQPSCLSFASQNRARCHQCYAIETAPPKCGRVWNQYCNIQIQGRS